MTRKKIGIILLVAALGAFALAMFIIFIQRNIELCCRPAVAADLQPLRTQLALYKKLNGTYPSTQQGLAAFVVKPNSSPLPNHWYQLFKNLPKDPWQNDYVYRQPDSVHPEYDLFSAGPDHVADTADDDWGE